MTSLRPAEVFPPGEFIREELEARGWTQADLAAILGRTTAMVSEIITGKRGISTRTANELAAAFGTTPELFINLQASYRHGACSETTENVSDMASLYQIAPVRDMIRRQWIPRTSSPAELRTELCRFFGIDILEDIRQEAIAARRSTDSRGLTISQRAWYYRAKNIAARLRVAPFEEGRLSNTQKRLRALAEYAPEARKVSRVLGESGIRFVVVEHLPGSKIDGAAFWLDPKSPVIAVSLRFDRIDSFWFTVMHEFCHVKRRDAILDPELFVAGGKWALAEEEAERWVDEEASDALIPKAILDSFILRVQPFFSKTNIIQFALRNKIHPGIVVGQLQHRGYIGYQADREMLVQIRETVANESVTDGWKRMLRIS